VVRGLRRRNACFLLTPRGPAGAGRKGAGRPACPPRIGLTRADRRQLAAQQPEREASQPGNARPAGRPVTWKDAEIARL